MSVTTGESACNTGVSIAPDSALCDAPTESRMSPILSAQCIVLRAALPVYEATLGARSRHG